MFVSRYKPGSKEWWEARITYRMDGLGYPIFMIGIVVAAAIGYHKNGLAGALGYGFVAFVVSEVVMQIFERLDIEESF